MNTEAFLKEINEIAKLEPKYMKGHDGSDGYCDCIGLIIGACRRNGIDWKWTHGSNYAARYRVINLSKISAIADLSPGDIVFKAHSPGESGYDKDTIDSKYANSGDLHDYYHVGVVTKVSDKSIAITHMTSPSITLDSKLGKWGYYGKLDLISEDMPMETRYAIVTADSGSTVKLRTKKSTTSSYENIPIDTKVEILERGNEWCKINALGKTGYMMTKFLLFVEEDDPTQGETVTVARQELEDVYDRIGNMLGLRG